MSTEIDENSVQTESVDVDSSVKENVSESEITGDSGIETGNSCTVALPTAADKKITPINTLESDIKEPYINDANKLLNQDSITPLSTPSSASPDINDATENLLSFGDLSQSKTDNLSSKTDHNLSTKDDMILQESGDQNLAENAGSLNSDSSNDVRSNEPMEDSGNFVINKFSSEDLDIDSRNCRTLATSTVSLNETKMLTTNNTTMCKSPYSRSAENISIIDQNQSQNASLNSSSKELNAEKILSQFNSQKNKASATQQVPDAPKIAENPQVTDARYARLPKELIPQDLGSIVKNVHGIFSSVSGSLKYAYNHTHRVSIPKPPVKLMKPIPNGRLMNDIFEDQSNEKSTTQVNGAEIVPEIPMIEELKPTETENVEVQNDPKKDVLRLQIESLETLLSEQRKENSILRERVKQQVDELQEKDQTFKELEIKLDLMSKRLEQAEREKDAAVMRYASVECSGIEARRAADRAATAEKAAATEVELLNAKLRSAHSEKQRICQMYDDKCHELSGGERELAKLREDVRELEGRLKWTQSKLRMEMDAYKESAERVEKLTQQVSELEAGKDAAIANASDSARAKQLEAELKESQAALILCRHEREELDRRLSSTTQQLELCRRERDTANSALSLATAEVEQLKESNLRLEEEAAELAALRAQAALADTLSAQLQRESERASVAEEALSSERARAETCARREASALEHAARVTQQHVAQRAKDTDHQAKAQALSLDNAALRESVSELKAECARAQAALAEEAERRNRESRVLARKVAELTEEVAEVSKRLEWEKGENGVLRKKHASAVKELNRELQRALKRCEQLEAKLPPPDAASTPTGSVSSLSSGESAPQEDRADRLHNGHADALPDIQVREPDRQALIERIVSLQRAAARRAERCEFLEEHSRQLTGELRAKSRLLRHLLCSMPAGAVASQDSDAHKKEIARLGGGAMAAVWGGDPTGMTLELSLEMNKRLQAVLEDALLKNITLKENMDTLGEEIARLKEPPKQGDTKPK